MSIRIKHCAPHCVKASGCCGCHKSKLNTIDYLADIPDQRPRDEQFVEVQFKNTRKGYFLNTNGLDLNKGDMVAVEASPGYDVGEVTLTGMLVDLQMRLSGYRHPNGVPRKICRLATESDLETFRQYQRLEEATMIESRRIANSLGLEMKIGDVEYQGDGTKAIFYYIADGRVDFRQLIRKLAEAFRIRIEMKQIGVRQEAGLIGGLGPCGRQLCCSGWLTNFSSVGTNAARLQDLSLNPQKLAGQCGKLKCCLNFEADLYLEAQQKLPPRQTKLQTAEGIFTLFKSDILSGEVTYIQKKEDRREIPTYVTITADRAFEIIEANKRGEVPFTMLSEHDLRLQDESTKRRGSGDILERESLTRFDKEPSEADRKGRGKRRARGKKQSSTNNKAPKSESKSREAQERTSAQRPEGEREGNPRARRSRRRSESRNNEPRSDARNATCERAGKKETTTDTGSRDSRQRRRGRRPQRGQGEQVE